MPEALGKWCVTKLSSFQFNSLSKLKIYSISLVEMQWITRRHYMLKQFHSVLSIQDLEVSVDAAVYYLGCSGLHSITLKKW